MWQAAFPWVCTVCFWVTGSLWLVEGLFLGQGCTSGHLHTAETIWNGSVQGATRNVGRAGLVSPGIAWISMCSPQGNSILLSSKSDLLCGVQQANNYTLERDIICTSLDAWWISINPTHPTGLSTPLFVEVQS